MKYEYGGIDYEGNDFYQYPNTNVLMNMFDIRDYDTLQKIEREISYANIVELTANPLKGVLDLKYLQRVHKFIFEEIYTWAGRIRGGGFICKGDTTFCNAQMILSYSDNIFGKLRQEKWLRSIDKDKFVKRMAYFMSEINTLHPFRDGNGRTQRIFFAELARRAKYELNFSIVNPDDLLKADIEAYNKNYSLLEELIYKMIN